MNKTIFKGTCTAAITPFTQDGVDYDALARQIEYQISNGIDALCILGTTGEAPTITDSEYEKIAKFSELVIYDNNNITIYTCDKKSCTIDIETGEITNNEYENEIIKSLKNIFGDNLEVKLWE